MSSFQTRRWWYGLTKNLNAKAAALPMIFTALVVFVGCSLWTVLYSFTKSKLIPVNLFQEGGFLGFINSNAFVGLAQYERLLDGSRNTKWAESVENIATYGIFSLAFSFSVGFVLAALITESQNSQFSWPILTTTWAARRRGDHGSNCLLGQ